jgi:hypothetical protein
MPSLIYKHKQKRVKCCKNEESHINPIDVWRRYTVHSSEEGRKGERYMLLTPIPDILGPISVQLFTLN